MQHSATPIPNPDHQEVCDIYEVFKNFFGEQYVDIQAKADSSYYLIYVWWPYVTVTNEFNKSVFKTSMQKLKSMIKVSFLLSSLAFSSTGLPILKNSSLATICTVI